MTEAGAKLLRGLDQMVEASLCDHDLTVLPREDTTAPPRFDRFHCSKCLATLWVPIPPERRN